MKTLTLTNARKYLSALKKYKGKYVTSERLSKVVGIYPEVISETLSLFDPLVTMDYNYDLKKLIPDLEKYIEDKEVHEKEIRENDVPYATKRKVDGYDDILDFVYRKMTLPSGIVDQSAHLTDLDLKILKKLVTEEQQKRKGNKR